MTEQEVFDDEHTGPWVYNGVEFKAGDRALIAFNPVNGSATQTVELHPFFVDGGMGSDGIGRPINWENIWMERMDYAVGGVHIIEDINEQGVEFETFVDDDSLHPHQGFRYPLSILVKQ